jgi:2-amino-4-hydroxy-6-hydroxymethyldihydropteridine diphosphokinase
MVVSYLGIGSNLGDRDVNIKKAIELLRKENIRVRKISRIIQTDPVGGPVQPKYLNAAVEIETDATPHKLLTILKSIEKKLGRNRGVKNGPRTIDLDILLYGDRKIKSRRLTIPHPRMRKRAFVMVPLSEIAPEIVKRLMS